MLRLCAPPRRLIVVALAAILVAAGCARVEGTGRRQLLLTSAAQEQRLGAQAYQEVLQEEQIADDPEMDAILQRVGRRLAAVAPDSGFEWEFTLLESDQPNAFCLPGGKVAVYTGILPYCKNEAGLATVMGHEIAHAIARHGGERMSQNIVYSGSAMALDAILQVNDVEPSTRNLSLAAFGLGAQVGVLLPYSRTHESEADELGLEYMAMAGYDPRAAPRFWERFSELTGGTPEFLSTHPHSDTRSADLESMLDHALERYRQADEQYGLGATLPQRYQR